MRPHLGNVENGRLDINAATEIVICKDGNRTLASADFVSRESNPLRDISRCTIHGPYNIPNSTLFGIDNGVDRDMAEIRPYPICGSLLINRYTLYQLADLFVARIHDHIG